MPLDRIDATYKKRNSICEIFGDSLIIVYDRDYSGPGGMG